MAKFKTFNCPSCDKLHELHRSLWLPDEGEVRATVQIVHGVAEYMGRYDAFARFLTEHGFAVCGEDHLGHGETGAQDGVFGYFGKQGGWDLVIQDVRELRQDMEALFPWRPYFLLGHSMGSFLTRTYLCRHPGTVDGAILSGTGQVNGALLAFGKALASGIAAVKGPDYVSPLVHNLSMGAYNKQFAPSRTSADWICRDEAVVDKYLQDPFCTFTPTVGLYRDMLGGLQYIASQAALSRMDPKTPIFLLSGDQDPVGENGAGVRRVYQFFKSHGTQDLTLKLYEGGRHEMLNETNKDEVYADVLSWLERFS